MRSRARGLARRAARSVGVMLVGALLPGALLPGAAHAQTPRPAQVVQIAGADLYLSLGTDAGLRTGDTLAVRRALTTAPVGSVVIRAATSTRSVVTFAGAPFPVTRGDTLFITPGAAIATAIAAVPVAIPAPSRANPPPLSRPSRRVDGAVALEMWGQHSEVTGLGADPVRTTRDVGMPAVRFNTYVSDAKSVFRVNLRAQQRTGPAGLWDRATRLRLYELRYDRTVGPMRVSLGRFFSDFDHASAFWDGASVRVGDQRGVSGGVAAGFEPLRGNEEFSAALPKVAAFVGTRHSTARVDLSTDLAVTQLLPRDATRHWGRGDLAIRLRVGRFSLYQDLEAAPPSPDGTWGITRFNLRASTPLGERGYLYGAVVSDRLVPFDSIYLEPIDRRERITGGVSLYARNGVYVDLNGSLIGPRDTTSGHSAGATVSVPKFYGGGAFTMGTSYFSDLRGHGLSAAPALEYRLGSARLRGGYQFFSSTLRDVTTTTHGIDLRLWRPFSQRVNWIVQLTERFGANLVSTTLFSSFEVRF